METISVDRLAISTLEQLNEVISNKLDGDCVFIKSGIVKPLDNKFRYVIEHIKEKKPRRKHLIIILETTGGTIEVVERLVSFMRKHYKQVSFIIPDYAYSAGTLLALSGNRIFMDDYSVLGPIDPQVKGVPGYGYLAKYSQLMKKIQEAKNPNDVKAERFYLASGFNPAVLFFVEQVIIHSIDLITGWLPKYKFKDWKETQTNQTPVTSKMKKERAEAIATTLGDATIWHSHGRGIGMEDLRGEDIKLMIDDFREDEELSTTIKKYHELALDYASSLGINDFILHKDGVQAVQIRNA